MILRAGFFVFESRAGGGEDAPVEGVDHPAGAEGFVCGLWALEDRAGACYAIVIGVFGFVLVATAVLMVVTIVISTAMFTAVFTAMLMVVATAALCGCLVTCDIAIGVSSASGRTDGTYEC
mmetsp:Transcript_10269/g.16546  ORF Transcript_10269/g.16546 Transcript_10269/m.16546 type:complete len:121 (+) Transcript_10269:769-1131(+)